MTFGGLPSRNEFSAALKQRNGWLYALAFWVFAYLLFSYSRSLRADLPPAYISLMRLVITGTGALLFRLVIGFMSAGEGRRHVLLIGMALVVPAAGLILALRLLLEGWIGTEMLIVADHIRWTIIWAGYFGVWIGIYAIQSLPAMLPALEGSADTDPAADVDAIWLDQRGRTERVPLEAIHWVEAEGNYVRVHADGSSGLLRISMARMEVRLRPAGFRRVHRSALCRPSDIATIIRRPSGAFAGVLKSGAEVPLSRDAAATMRQTERNPMDQPE